MKEMLKFIADGMKAAGVQYHLNENKSKKVTYPYWVGELLPVDTMNEDGMKEFSLVLDGFNRKSENTEGTLLELLFEAEKIEEMFPVVGGKTSVVDNQAIAVFYGNSSPVESGDEQLKRLQITLSVKLWKGSN